MKRLTTLILILLLSVPAVARDATPLYSGNGWRVLTGRSGDWMLDKPYYRRMETSVPFMWMAHQGASNFYCFTIEIDRGVGVIWKPESRIVLTYEAGGEIFTATSGEYIFFNKCLTKVIHAGDVRYTALPSFVFSTPPPRVVPVVFFRFDFEEYPTELISCEPLNVLERGGR